MKRFRRPKRVIKRESFVETKDGRIPLVLTRSTGRRTLTITVDEDARASVAAPFNMADQDIANFIIKKADWIHGKVAEARKCLDILAQRDFNDGQDFLFLGEKYKVNVKERDVKRCQVSFEPRQGWNIFIPLGCSQEVQRAHVKEKMLQWYRAQAQEILGGRIFHFARLIGAEPKKINVRTQKRIWGCCDFRTQTINLNWQIILSPLRVVDYVVVHELCHLFIPNHSKRFWKKVEKVMPDFRQRRQWLKANHLDMILP